MVSIILSGAGTKFTALRGSRLRLVFSISLVLFRFGSEVEEVGVYRAI
jgi:hypothetical protein